jgi:tRNA dimethylallyltransferase
MLKRETHNPVIVLAGPTGVGKTEISLHITNWLPVEIISADSRQIYKKMDIGTAKPAKSILEQIPHHFVDYLDPAVDYSAGEFGIEARQKISEILKIGKIPLIVGGSGLYIRAVLEGFFEGELKDEKVRRTLKRRLQAEGPEKLYKELEKVDMPLAESTHPRNGKRIIRGLEVYQNTGKRLSDLHRKKPASPPDFGAMKFGLLRERSELYRRINQRVELMFREGFLEEVENLLNNGYDKQLNSLNTVGYKEAIDYLEGQTDLKTCIDLIKRNTRHYAKRQLTWFRAEDDIRWMMLEDETPMEEIAKRIVQKYQQEFHHSETTDTNQ